MPRKRSSFRRSTASRTRRVRGRQFSKQRRFGQSGQRRFNASSRSSRTVRQSGGGRQTVRVVVEHRNRPDNNSGTAGILSLIGKGPAPAPKRPRF